MAVVNKYVAIGEEPTAEYGDEVAAVDYINVPRVNPKEFVKWVDQEGIARSALGSSEIGEKGSNVDWDMYVNFVDGVGWILKWTLGPATSAKVSTTTAYTHTYKGDDVLRSFTILIGTEDLGEVPYPGQVVKTLEISSSPGGYLMFKVTTYGKYKAADNAIGSPTFSGIVPAMHHNLVFKVDTVDKTSTCGATSITINNNIREGALAAGSVEPQTQPKHTNRRVEWSAEQVDYDVAMRTAFLAGTKMALQWKWTGSLIEETFYYGLQVDLGEAGASDYDHALQGRDVELHKYGGFAEYKATDTEILVVLTNTDTAYADAT